MSSAKVNASKYLGLGKHQIVHTGLEYGDAHCRNCKDTYYADRGGTLMGVRGFCPQAELPTKADLRERLEAKLNELAREAELIRSLMKGLENK